MRKCYIELQTVEHNHLPNFYADPESSVDAYLEYLFNSIEVNSGKIYVADMDGEITGFVGVTLGEDDDPCVMIHKFVYVTDLVVLEKYRKRGIGEQLIQAAEKYGKENGEEYISLHVTKGNPSFNFYQKLGFKEYTTSLKKKLE